MKKRVLVLLCVAVMTVSVFAGCKKNEDVLDLSGNVTNDSADGNASDNQELPKVEGELSTDNGYIFMYDGNVFTIGVDMVPIYEKYGDSVERGVSGSCKYDGDDADYTFSDFKVTAFIDGDVERIYAIELTSDLVETMEGVAIGDNASEIVAAYGEPKEAGFYQYESGNMTLLFSVVDDVVTSISYIEK